MATNKLGFTGTPGSNINTSSNNWCFKITGLNSTYALEAPEDGSCDTLYVYKDDTEIDVIVGVYDESDDLVASVSISNDNGVAGYVSGTCTSFSVTEGSFYYPVLLTNDLQQVLHYDSSTDNASSRVADITALPDPWTEVKNRDYAPAVYMEYDGTASIGCDALVLSSLTLSSPVVGSTISCDNLTLSTNILGSASISESGETITCDTLTFTAMEIGLPEVLNVISCDTMVLGAIVLNELEMQGVIYCDDLVIPAVAILPATVIGEIECNNLVLNNTILGVAIAGEITPISPDVISVPGEITMSWTITGELV